jgi:hypothetical protein
MKLPFCDCEKILLHLQSSRRYPSCRFFFSCLPASFACQIRWKCLICKTIKRLPRHRDEVEKQGHISFAQPRTLGGEEGEEEEEEKALPQS